MRALDVINDERIQDAVVKLNDALCMFERNAGQEHLFILAQVDGPEIHVSMSGKPLWEKSLKRDALSAFGLCGAVLKKHGVLKVPE